MPRHATKTSFKKGHVPWYKLQGIKSIRQIEWVNDKITKTREEKEAAGLYDHSKVREMMRKRRGMLHPQWKGGFTRRGGYPAININGSQTQLHKLVAQQTLGRCLRPRETVHHIDGDKENYRPGNLFICSSQGQHNRIHGTMENCMFALFKRGIVSFNPEKGAYECLPID